MATTHVLDISTREDIHRRISRIEGQARGVARMVDDGRDCQEVMHQLLALKAATHSLTLTLFEKYAHHCLLEDDPTASLEDKLQRMVRMVSQLSR